MKLSELLIKQRLIIQLLWGEQKIEFSSEVIETDGAVVYVSPYLHNGSELEINVKQGKDVVCNIYTDNPNNKQRISWKNVELTTVIRNAQKVYCLKTSAFNQVASRDDRRLHERIIIQVKAHVFDGNTEEGTEIIVHDISDIGISFYAPANFAPKSQQLVIKFTDTIDEKEFNVKVDCIVSRMNNKAGNLFAGCKIVGEPNRDYQLYGFMKRLKEKNKL